MGDRSGISWTDATWNPVRGCSRVSEGCRNCYAEAQAARIVRMGRGEPTLYDGLVRIVRGDSFSNPPVGGEPRWTGNVVLDPTKLADPMRWQRPRRVFANSMSDLFHESLANEQIAAVFGVMAAAGRHTFQVLTKRARRMRDWFEWIAAQTGCTGSKLALVLNATAKVVVDVELTIPRGTPRQERAATWPLPNVWLGVSVENQAAVDERINELLRTPAAVRFLSCEPLLGRLDLGGHLAPLATCRACTSGEVPAGAATGNCEVCADRPAEVTLPGVDWVIAGCESGPGARRCDVAWLRELRDQCAAAGVPYFLKQARQTDDTTITFGNGSKRKPGRIAELPYLDGSQHAAFPEVPRG